MLCQDRLGIGPSLNKHVERNSRKRERELFRRWSRARTCFASTLVMRLRWSRTTRQLVASEESLVRKRTQPLSRCHFITQNEIVLPRQARDNRTKLRKE
eukprot:COSAG06_NODE_4622_length_4092_cov_2.411971_2_plen_99_part_00